MIADCFTFFNELELLELRCEELKGIVGCHFLIESPTTFAGKPKPLYFVKNRARFAKYPILPILVNLPYSGDITREQAWQNDHSARKLGYEQVASLLHDDTTVLISDVDEIPRASMIMDFPDQIVVFLQRCYTYYLNWQSSEEWRGTIRMPVAKLRQLGGMSAYAHRWSWQHHNGEPVLYLKDAGWHFSYQGGTKRVQDKLQAAAHTEYGGEFYTDPVRLAEKFASGEDLFDRQQDGFHKVPIDETFPEYLVNHQDRFKDLIDDQKTD